MCHSSLFRSLLLSAAFAATGASVTAQPATPAAVPAQAPASPPQAGTAHTFPLNVRYISRAEFLTQIPKPKSWQEILEGYDPEKPPIPKYLYFTWAGLAAGAHLSADRDVRSTWAARDAIREAGAVAQEANPLARGMLDGGGLRPAAHAGAAVANALSLWILKQNRFRALKGAFWVPQVALIVFTNVAASRNHSTARACQLGRC